ncbi:MAG: hypothetical protein ACLRSW_10165 [Christensenellaceae bacterium]
MIDEESISPPNKQVNITANTPSGTEVTKNGSRLLQTTLSTTLPAVTKAANKVCFSVGCMRITCI